ncbi:hypothetical protein Trydic_g5436 [Trypoxylus dichotomus]
MRSVIYFPGAVKQLALLLAAGYIHMRLFYLDVISSDYDEQTLSNQVVSITTVASREVSTIPSLSQRDDIYASGIRGLTVGRKRDIRPDLGGHWSSEIACKPGDSFYIELSLPEIVSAAPAELPVPFLARMQDSTSLSLNGNNDCLRFNRLQKT